ncbi:MAG: carboxypeptidase-like regulatory domain-containing protein [Thermoleophilaceae bacterium]
MLRRTLSALWCAFTLGLIAVSAAVPTASAQAGPTPTLSNQTTGWDSGGSFVIDETAVGDQLQGDAHDWAGTLWYTYSWSRCRDTAGNGCTAISGATADAYAVTELDVGAAIEFCARSTTTGATACSSRTALVASAHADADRDGYFDYGDDCRLVTGVLVRGCPDYEHQPSIKNETTGGGVDSEVAVGDTILGDPSTWAGSTGPYQYEIRRCISKWCTEGSELIENPTAPVYTVHYSDYGSFIQFCAIDAAAIRMCSKGAGTSFGTLAAHTDADRDGVADFADKCPSTAATTSDGCPAPIAAPPSTTTTEPMPTTSSAPMAATESNAAPPPDDANGVGASRGARLTALINNRSRAMKVRFGKKATITGHLLDPSGKSIAGAQLVVLTKRAAATARFAKVTTVPTDANGRYTYVAPAGESRIVRVAYYAFTNDTAVADASEVTLLVAGALTLKAPKRIVNEHAATFRGQLRGKPVPKAGVLIDLQVWFHNKWRTFATPRTNAKGAFRYKYRFTQGAATWTFRARFRKDSLYPYELSYSKRLSVRVAS